MDQWIMRGELQPLRLLKLSQRQSRAAYRQGARSMLHIDRHWQRYLVTERVDQEQNGNQQDRRQRGARNAREKPFQRPQILLLLLNCSEYKTHHVLLL